MQEFEKENDVKDFTVYTGGVAEQISRWVAKEIKQEIKKEIKRDIQHQERSY